MFNLFYKSYVLIRFKSLWRWYINTNIIFLDIIQLLVFSVLKKNMTMDNVKKYNIWTYVLMLQKS
jgi:hypothetical protein